MEFIFTMYTGFGMDTGKITIYVLLYVTYIFIILYVLSAKTLLETRRNIIYIYTRTTKKYQFYLFGILNQLKKLYLVQTAFNIGIFIINHIFGNSTIAAPFILKIIILNYLHIGFLIASLNLSSLLFKTSLAINCVFTFDIFCVLAVGGYIAYAHKNLWWFKYLPTICALKEFNGSPNWFYESAVILCIETLVLLVVGAFLAQRVDIS